ncbi:TRAP transporter large permease [Tropicimonas sp. IMCC34043]|uniref:TRAP transporter large permease n=1 Tax=Tropicimonas sp. IMCC34043 TaxID=2248760 RepID=UPI000E257B24|nr:TRAP transporter large permease [Tropicimonas sp. IMCC34043]
MTAIVLVFIFFCLILIGVPIAVALGGSALATSLLLSPLPPAIIGQKIFGNLEHLTLMAVPFFFFASALMESGGLVKRLIALSNSLVGHWRGGLGITTVLTCVFFAALSGSSPATVAAVGRIMYPALLNAGYSTRYALGALTTAGSIGILIPPSIPMLIYAFVTETSVTRLFLAGVVPGIIYAAGMVVAARFLALKEDIAPQERMSWPGRGQALLNAGPALMLPLMIIVGIYGFPDFSIGGLEVSGGALFTPTEAAVLATFLAFLIGWLVYRELTVRTAIQRVIDTAPSVGMIFFITTNALFFAFFITQLGIPQWVTETLVALDMPLWMFLLMINILLVIVGFFLEGVPTILMFVPVLFPAAREMGIDPVHFAIIVIVNIELGLVTPPVGLNLFVGSAISNQPATVVLRGTLPWMVVTVAVLILVTYVPGISLWLPNYVFGD